MDVNDLIFRHFINDLSPEEEQDLACWIQSSPQNRHLYLEQQEIWFSATDNSSLSRFDKDAAYQLFKEQVKQSQSSRRRYRWLKYAAAAVLLLAISYYSYLNGASGIESSFSDIVIEAPYGSRTKMFLPDGTLVWLNAGSKISYSQGFGVKDRQVRLEGEGYFEVVRNENVPFFVVSENLNMQVLGTKFNFRDYRNDTEAVISLTEGKVSLRNLMMDEKEYVLLPGQHAILNKVSGRLDVKQADTALSSQWTQGVLVFNGESLAEIAKKLERSYNVKVTILDKKLSNYHFYGDFIRQEQTLRELLDDLSATGKIRYKIQGKKVILY